MKKLLFLILVIIIIVMTSTSCIRTGENNIDVNKKSSDKIQLWYYLDENNDIYTNSVLKIVDSAKNFCDANKIPLETIGYNAKTLSHEDYIFKRNLAVNFGNVIIIDDIMFLKDLSKQHAEYTKLQNYDKLLKVNRDRFCIPLGSLYGASSIDNKAIEYYNLKPEKPLITFSEYLEIKQEMKKRGAKFEFNRSELFEIVSYYQYKNGLLYLDEESEIIKNKKTFKQILKKSTLDICNDIIKYYESNLELVNDLEYRGEIYEQNSGYKFERKIFSLIDTLMTPNYRKYIDLIVGDLSTRTIYFDYFYYARSPYFFMSEKVTNEKIYDIANHIVSEETYMMLIKDSVVTYFPVFDMIISKKSLQVNDNLEYIGEDIKNPKIIETINLTYEMLIKDENKSKEISDNIFLNNYQSHMKLFILDFINDAARKLSSDNKTNALSLEGFNPQDKELNKMLDKKLDEFMAEFSTYN